MAPSRGAQAFLQVGLPLMFLTIGGYVGVAHVLSGKFELRVSQIRLGACWRTLQLQLHLCSLLRQVRVRQMRSWCAEVQC